MPAIKAQPYKSIFAQDTTQWNVMYRFWDPIKSSEFKDTNEYLYRNFITVIHKIYGDTAINLQSYHYFTGYNMMFSQSEFNGYIREDTTSGKVWYRRITDVNERLIMDFSLDSGDTFTFISFPFNDTIIAKVDSVRYINGSKQIYFDTTLLFPDGRKFCFMEGIGSNYLPFAFVDYDWVTSSSLLCAYKDGLRTYSCNARKPYTATGDSCNWWQFFGAVKEFEQPLAFKIYPNPACNNLFIEYNGNEIFINCNLEVYNILGELVFEKEISSFGKEITLSLNDFPNGIFYLKISSEGKLISSNKFIIAK
jgi:hypothetical protein